VLERIVAELRAKNQGKGKQFPATRGDLLGGREEQPRGNRVPSDNGLSDQIHVTSLYWGKLYVVGNRIVKGN